VVDWEHISPRTFTQVRLSDAKDAATNGDADGGDRVGCSSRDDGMGKCTVSLSPRRNPSCSGTTARRNKDAIRLSLLSDGKVEGMTEALAGLLTGQ
jgi:hypothetical protein